MNAHVMKVAFLQSPCEGGVCTCGSSVSVALHPLHLILCPHHLRPPQLMNRANLWAAQRSLQHRLRYLIANAAISLPSLLASYPGPVKLVCVQVGQGGAPHGVGSGWAHGRACGRCGKVLAVVIAISLLTLLAKCLGSGQHSPQER